METPTSALPAGTMLKSPSNVYNIIKTLGAGGFGITYLATVDITAAGVPAKALVAIKEHFLSNDCDRVGSSLSVSYSKPSASRVQNSLKDFIAEARRLQPIAGKHPDIVNVSEVFEANNTAYYVMEYLHGKSLKDYVSEHNSALSLAEAMQIIVPVIDAVAFLHVNRITHLDIKPANIMLSKKGDGKLIPTLIDFGLSKHYNSDGSATATVNMLGFSDGYSPVEQYIGITEFSPTADVYSLAATLLFCLTGQTPPKSNEVNASVIGSLLPASTPKSVRRAIIKAMSMRIADRYADASQLYEALTGRKLHYTPLSGETGEDKNAGHNSPDDDEETELNGSLKATGDDIVMVMTLDDNNAGKDSGRSGGKDESVSHGGHKDNRKKQKDEKDRSDDSRPGISDGSNGRMRKVLTIIIILIVSIAIGVSIWYCFFYGNGIPESMNADAERYVQLEYEVDETFRNHEYDPEAYAEAVKEFDDFKDEISTRYNTPLLKNEFESACRKERNQ